MNELNSNIEEDKKNEDRSNDIIIDDEEEECIGCETGADRQVAHSASCTEGCNSARRIWQTAFASFDSH